MWLIKVRAGTGGGRHGPRRVDATSPATRQFPLDRPERYGHDAQAGAQRPAPSSQLPHNTRRPCQIRARCSGELRVSTAREN